MKCDKCVHMSYYNTGADEYPPCAAISYCSKGHWEESDIEQPPPDEMINDNYWDNCKDYLIKREILLQNRKDKLKKINKCHHI